jgi:H+-transporting ATPase
MMPPVKRLGVDDNERMTGDEAGSLLAPDLIHGLTSEEAELRRLRFGPNEVGETKPHPVRDFIKKFWGLTAWMLEAIILLSWFLGKFADVAIVGALLIVNAVISSLEERKSSRAVEELKAKLQIHARTLRDGVWTLVPSRDLVPGDILRVRSGDFIPADLKIVEGAAAADQSALTGESMTVDKKPEDRLYAGSVIKRGEATGVVIGTGAATNYGKTTQLVQLARPKLHMEEVVARLVKRLLLIIGGLLVLTMGVSVLRGYPFLEILPLMLVLLLSAIPVALPVMFTVSLALGARELAKDNVLVTRLSATEDAATMDVLCVDKTGTLTLNELSVSRIFPLGAFSEEDVILFGALASREANQDPLDLAFIRLARERGLGGVPYIQESFVPFDPETRKTEARIRREHESFRVLKGAVAVIVGECGLGTEELAALEARLEDFSKAGSKTLAVARQNDGRPEMVGLAALRDGLRPDSKDLIQALQALGVSVKMLTGDALPIARQIAREVGLGSEIAPMADLKTLLATEPAAALSLMEKSAGFAEVYPEDKFLIVQSLQAGRHVVGMTGDGVNDAPALKQAEVGIAVKSATDIAKASASVVLTSPGLSGIVTLVRNGRKIYQRINTWILNKIMRTILKTAFIVGVFLITGDFVVSAFAMVLLLLMTDFVKISLSTDRVRWSRSPDTWNIAAFVKVAAVLGGTMVLESLILLRIGLKMWHWLPSDPHVRTFSFAILLFSALTSLWVIRERRHFWSSSPSRVLLIAVLADMFVGILISSFGIPGALPPIPFQAILLILGYNAVVSLFVNDLVKIRLMEKVNATRL